MGQFQMLRAAEKREFTCNRLFVEMMKGPNPITKDELRALIKKRPEIWGRFQGYLESDYLS